MNEPKYKKALVKLSGEAMQAKDGSILDFDFLGKVADVLIRCVNEGTEIAVVAGAGNIWRGQRQGKGMNRCRADNMGMLATVINSIALKDVIIQHGGKAAVMTPVEMPEFADKYVVEKACEYMKAGIIVIIGCGTGNPYFSTDTGAVLRAAELGTDIVLMAKNIDGIYDKDPLKYSDAHKYESVSYNEILDKKLAAYDLTATAFCAANSIKTCAFGLKTPENIYRAVKGENIGTITY